MNDDEMAQMDLLEIVTAGLCILNHILNNIYFVTALISFLKKQGYIYIYKLVFKKDKYICIIIITIF